MLLPEQFDTSSEPPSFLLAVEDIQIGELRIGPTKVLVSYDSDWRPLLNLESCLSADVSMKLAFSGSSSASLELKGSRRKIPVILTKIQTGTQSEMVTVEARLQREPLVLPGNGNAQGFKAVLVSAPEFLKLPIKLIDECGIGFEIMPFKETKSSYLLGSNAQLDSENPLKPLANLIDFLTFVKGAHCGLGNLIAFDKHEATAFQLLGFTRTDTLERQTNWFDLGIQKDLPTIFQDFVQAMSDGKTAQAIRQTINFYRASNVSRRVSVEMSIIAAHSALEAIVNYILAHHAGWSEKLMSERTIAFSDKMRAAASHFGMHGDVLAHSPELTALSKSRNKMDAFELISFIRNKLVHQDANLVPTGIQLHEAWSLAQWLIEVLVFGVIGFRGEIIDRRIYSGWRGTTCQIPLSR